MGTRLELHEVLVDILGSRNVYFQPPSTIQMKYPAIVYSRSRIEKVSADDGMYKQSLVYDVTVIDKNPDSELPFKLAQLPMCRHDRAFVSDNLNHNTFTLYF